MVLPSRMTRSQWMVTNWLSGFHDRLNVVRPARPSGFRILLIRRLK